MGKLYRTEGSQIKSRNADGSQNREYYTKYYRENKERITQLNKNRYSRVRSSPELLKIHRYKSAEAINKWRLANPEKQALARKRAYLNRKRYSNFITS